MNKGNVKKNLIFSLLSQIAVLALSFAIPKVIMSTYGSDTNGFINTISQIFIYVSLLEAGIGQSTRNALFNPVKNDDKNEICRILSITKKYCHRVSFVYLLIVVALSFALPFLLKTELDFFTIFFYTLLEGMSSVVTIFFLNTWINLLMVEGKNYVVNIIYLITKVVCYSLKLLLCIFGLNICLIQVGYLLVSLLQVVFLFLYMKKHYSWIKLFHPSNRDVLPDKNSYVINEIALAVFSSTDMIVLSIFISTTLSSVYSVYNIAFLALNSIVSSIYNSLNYKLGQTFVTDVDLYKKTHDIFNSVFLGSMTALMSVAVALSSPFVELYTNGVTDVNYIYPLIPAMLGLVQILSWSRNIASNLSGIAGYAKQASIISIIEASMNIVLSVVLVYFCGIYGVLLATIISLPIKVVYLNLLADKVIMKRNPKNTILIIAANYFVFVLAAIIFYVFPLRIKSILSFVSWGLLLTFISFVTVFSINMIVGKDLRLALLTKLSRLFKGKKNDAIT